MEANRPDNEAERQQALDSLNILDTLPEESFDRLTRLAVALLGVPIAAVSLVDRDRQWFKSRVGLEASQTPRSVAFCAHAVLDSEVLVVPDATGDERFADNPLVTGELGIRFYAGAPLEVGEGLRVGTLCAIDTKPRTLTAEQRQALADMAALVVDEFKFRHRLSELEAARAEIQTHVVALRHANESLEQFAYMAAHDLRAPLKTIVNLVDLAELDDGEKTAEHLGYIRDVAGRLERLVSGYRRLSRLSLGERTRVSLSSLLASAQTSCATEVSAQLSGDVEIDCDEDLLVQAFANLFANATEHGTSPRVDVDFTAAGDVVAVRVRNAIEEPFEVDAGVFAPFRRLSGNSTGLGLAIVDRIVKLHGGSARAACEGKSFVIELELPGQAR